MLRIEPAAWWRVQSGCLRLRRRSGFDLNPTVAEVGLWGVPAVVVGWGVRPDTPCNARPALRERIRSALLPNLILVILSYHPLLSYFILSDHISSDITPTLLPYVLWVPMGIANYWMAKMVRMNAASLYGLLQHPVTLGWDKDRKWENSSWKLNLCLELNANMMSFKKTCLPKNDRRVLQMLQKESWLQDLMLL